LRADSEPSPSTRIVVNFAFSSNYGSNWTALRRCASLCRMIIILVLALAVVAGMLIRSRWALLLPLGIGALAALTIVARGGGLGDTPIPFLVVVCTLVMVGGQGLRPRLAAPVS
jgi:hypothetical protein